MKAKFQSNEINELKDEFYNLFNVWVERVTPTFAEPFFTLRIDGFGFYLSLTEEDEFDASISWEFFEQEVLSCDNKIIKIYLPKFTSLVQRMEKELEGEQ